MNKTTEKEIKEFARTLWRHREYNNEIEMEDGTVEFISQHFVDKRIIEKKLKKYLQSL